MLTAQLNPLIWKLTEDEITYLEELYVPHALVGVMAQNGKQKLEMLCKRNVQMLNAIQTG